jgi:Domain of unknown function (DUF1877)
VPPVSQTATTPQARERREEPTRYRFRLGGAARRRDAWLLLVPRSDRRGADSEATIVPMSLGVAFALTAEQTEELLALSDDESRDEWLQDLEEEVGDPEWFQYDKVWDELHRCLGDGELAIQDLPPLAHAVFGSRPLMEDEDSATFAGYLPAAEVPTVAASLRQVERGWLRERFDALSRTDYTAYGSPLDDDLFEHVWACLEGLRDFYMRLVDEKSAMVFSVDG